VSGGILHWFLLKTQQKRFINVKIKKSKYIEIVQIFLNVSYKLLQYKINYNLEYGIHQEIAEDKMLRRCS